MTVPVASVQMRCCGTLEEDENTVDWSSGEADGYLHWSRAECRT